MAERVHNQFSQWLLSACTSVLERSDLPAPERDSESCLEWLRAAHSEYLAIWEMEDAANPWDDPNLNAVAANQWLLELAAIVSVDLLSMINLRLEHKQPLFWDHQTEIPSEGLPVLLRAYFGQLCDYNLEMSLLAQQGLELQLLILFRGYVELAEQILLSALDQSHFSQYLKSCKVSEGGDEHQRYKHWRSNLSPARVRTKLDTALGKSGLPVQDQEELAQYREATYSWLSQHHHGDPLALVVRSYSDAGPVAGGGRITDRLQELLSKVTWFNFEFFCFLRWALGSKHGWTMDPRKPLCIELMFKWNLLTTLSLDLMYPEKDAAD